MNKVYYLLMAVAIFLLAGCGSSLNDDKDLSVDDTNAPMHIGISDASSLTPQAQSLAPQIRRAADHGGGYGWKKDKCLLCHTARELQAAHQYSPALAESLSSLSESDIGVCLFCHGSNGLRVTVEMYQCMKCHTDSKVVESANMFAGSSMHDVTANGRMDNADCVICHAFSDMNGEIDIDIDFRKGASDYTDLSAFCLNCHDGNGAFGILPPELSTGMGDSNLYSTYKGMGDTPSAQKQTADIHGARNGWRSRPGPGAGSSGQGPGPGQGPGAGNGQGPGQGGPTLQGQESMIGSASLRGAYTNGMEVACLDCHQVHSSNNPYLITQSGASAELTDDVARGAAVTVTVNDFTQLCAVCHTSLDGAPTDNGLTTVVHSGTYSAYCTDCHYHGAGFEGTAGLF